ncbi:MAG: CDP-alcohol phosphatidyltransferase family protein [Desulfobacterales bacterium]|jgi:phosphatidylglycerophosphate synthase
MTIYAHIIKDSPIQHWGLTSSERIQRVLNSAGVTRFVDDVASLPDTGAVILLRGDYLFDDRVIKYIVDSPDLLLQVPGNQHPMIVAAKVGSHLAGKVADIIKGNDNDKSWPEINTEDLETLSISFQENLLKFEPPFVLPITSENQQHLERRLFDWSYKGVTDLVTKWAWPRPARWVVGHCVRLGLRPNHVTVIGLFLVIIAGYFFARGWYGWGLLAGWLMTFLDTVDGKLARVTVTSSRFGHYFDHLIDLVHPPIWYILWGLGLGVAQIDVIGISLAAAGWLIVIGYIVGRLVEGVFLARLGKFGLFCWRPVDSYFRLITARRNPCLIFLTIGAFLGRPDVGLAAVTVWTVLTSIFLCLRLAMALHRQKVDGSVRSWFLDINPTSQFQPLAVKLFTMQKYN